MPYYKVCSFCGAHLDPDERCDCRRARGKSDGSGDYAGGTEEWQYGNPSEGSRPSFKGDIRAEEQQESGADGL